MEESQNYVGAFECHGVEFTRTSGIQSIGTCPFCDKEDHFYVNRDTGQWDCKACGENGNVITFLGKIAELWHEETSEQDFKALAKLRGISATTLKNWGLGWDGDYWLIPCRASSGQVHDLRRWDPESGRILSTSGCTVQLFGADRLTKASRDRTTWLCEGEFDAMALHSILRRAHRRDVVVAVPGAGIFKKAWPKLFRDRPVRLCYDADKAGAKGTEKAVSMLRGIARSLHAIRWHGDTPDGFDVRDMISAERKRGKSPRSLIKRLEAMLEPVDDLPAGDLTEHESESRGITDPHVLASTILAQHYTASGSLAIRFYHGGWWIWENGRYRNIDDVELRAMVNGQLLRVLDDADNLKYVEQSLVANTVRAMESKCLVKGTITLPAWLGEEPITDGTDLLAMANGLLDLDAAILEEEQCLRVPTSEWFSLTSWAFGFDPEATCRTWRRFLKEVLPRESERFLLQEYLGYCLSFDTSQHRFLVLVGEGANGKSVVTEVATHCLGHDNVTHVGLERFGDRFSMAPMMGKLANIVSELGVVRGVAEDFLKAVVSGDRVQVEFKFKSPVYVSLTTRLLFATNELPVFRDRSRGLWRRLMILPFNVTIPEEKQDKTLARTICDTEAPGVFNWMLAGLRRLRERGAFRLPSSSRRAVEGHRRTSNPALAFLEERCRADQAGQVLSAQLYSRYALWCEHQRLRPLTKQQFGQEVRRNFPAVQRVQRREGGDRQYYYVGLSLRSGRRTRRSTP